MKHTLKTLLAAFALLAVIISAPVFSADEHATDAAALPTVSVDKDGNATTADGKSAADGSYSTTNAEGKTETVTVKDGKVAAPAASE